MGRTRLDKFKSLFKFHKRGYGLGAQELVCQLSYQAETLSDAELDEYVAVLPDDVLLYLTQWAAKHPTDEAGWHESMGRKWLHISSVECHEMSMEEKQAIRVFVERVRCAIAHLAPDKPPSPAPDLR